MAEVSNVSRIDVVRVGSTEIGNGKPVFVIAEIGINHNGDVGTAKKLIDVATAAGEEETKYGSDYFDENTEEVIQGKRPIQVEPERQEDPFSDMPSEEDWPKQASYKLL